MRRQPEPQRQRGSSSTAALDLSPPDWGISAGACSAVPLAGERFVSMRWLSARVTDNRYVVAVFLALAVVNAYAMQAGYYR